MSGIMCVAASHTDAPGEVTNWYSKVNSTGGTFTSNSLSLAKNFMKAVSSSSYYPKIKYLLPMLGGNLSASLVPLVDTLGAGPVTNSGFLNADFSESSGLTSNGSGKILITSFKGNALGTTNNAGIGYWELNTFPSDPNQAEPIGTYANNGQYRYGLYLKTSTARRKFWWGDANNWAGDELTPSTGNYYGQRSSLTSRKIYYNGAQIGATNTTSDTMTGVGDNSMRLLGSYQVGANVYVASKCGLAYFTDGTLTAQEITDFHSALNTYLITGSLKNLEPEVASFKINSGITDQAILTTLNTFVGGMKTNNLWNKMIVVYPFVGGTSTTHKYNLKDPTNYTIDFQTEVTHNSNGVDFGLYPSAVSGSTGYNITGSTANSFAFGAYIRDNAQSYSSVMGAGAGAGGANIFPRYNDGNAYFRNWEGTGGISVANSDSRRLFVCSRTATNAMAGYRDGTSLVTGTGAQGTPDNDIMLLSGFNQCFAFMSEGLTAGEVATLTTLVNTMQTSLSRNV